jgi:hypothetical protein
MKFRLDPATGDALMDPSTGDFLVEEDEATPAKPKTTTQEALFPKREKAIQEGAGGPRRLLARGVDLATLIPRALFAGSREAVSLGKTDFREEMAGKGKKSIGQSLAGDVSTPAVLATLPVTGPAAVAARAAPKFIKALPHLLKIGATEGAAASAAGQMGNVSDGKPVNPKEIGLEVALNAAFPIIGGAGGRALKKTGERITEAVLKPKDAAYNAGFKIEDLFKNKLGGSVNTIKKKATDLRADEGAKLNQTLRSSGKNINAVQIWSETVGELEDQVKDGKLSGEAVKAISESLRKEINAVADPETGEVSAAVADNLKRRFQRVAKPLYTAQNTGADIQGGDKAVFAGALASNLRKKLEREVPGVIEPNRILSETKGVKMAADHAVKRTDKNNPLSLTDILILSGLTGLGGGAVGGKEGAIAGGGTTAAGLFAANRASKSTAFGNLLYQMGDKAMDPAMRQRLIREALKRASITGVDEEDQ